ncbi:MAG: ABC transporter ATP-binding protein [Ilumatobacteraceae bacterium]|nr:ABC transporter ATP-binding protein [Ilumatobacteraceae bacterium]MDP4735612.1 ABC transporter ATP-binding protein [Ilumatobacteraceae bacterium]
MLEIDKVSIIYDSSQLFANLSLTIKHHEIVALTGPSGSGKTTLLRCIAGLESISTGSIHLNGHDITDQPAHLRNIGMVFQDNQLFPHLTVGQNVAYSLKIKRTPKKITDNKVREVLSLVGLNHLIDRTVTNLSGGEAKRVAVARALIAEPQVLLLDEPLTGLDIELHGRLLEDLGKLLRTRGTTVLHVTHDKAEASAIADRVLDLRQLIS